MIQKLALYLTRLKLNQQTVKTKHKQIEFSGERKIKSGSKRTSNKQFRRHAKEICNCFSLSFADFSFAVDDFGNSAF